MSQKTETPPTDDLLTNQREDGSALNTPEAIEDFALKDDYALNPRYISLVIDAADRGDGLRLRELLGALHPADIADLLGFLSQDYREEVIPWIPSDALADILPELDDDIREEVIGTLHPQDLAEVLQELDSDDAAAVFEDLEADQQKAVLAAMPEAERAAIVTSLAYEEETAGRLMQREVVAAPSFWHVGQTIDRLRENGDDLPELFFDIYVIDPSHKPIGALPVSVLMRSRRDVALSALMEPITEIRVDQDQEEVAYIFEKYHLISAPVVDSSGRLVGQITVDDIVNIIQEESQEDMLALAGVSSDSGRDASIFGVVKSRFWWLLINLFTAVLASSVIGLFQDAIAKLVALAVLNPICASMGGNAGTQTLTVAVRALATRELNAANLLRTVWREIAAGVLNGLAFAVVMGLVTMLWFHDWKMALVIGMAMIINLFAAAVAGILIPLGLDRMGYDPAASATVFVTTVTDCVGFFSFLGLAVIILL
ncbi:magnesium transporter [Asticcacaulis sp. EMRT-3]|uniref:magnesium transporter n=1 Tax=Asticcacaulis sp. EMRT-3 TaxID=3040349 RepID=UPI0024AF3BE8|nr:magnesium transporter [Asticcacaulis sp. EMRT-3]MDI7775039.1 magnesium transporter [Asticcacaulis sp. EMRT-3]